MDYMNKDVLNSCLAVVILHDAIVYHKEFMKLRQEGKGVAAAIARSHRNYQLTKLRDLRNEYADN